MNKGEIDSLDNKESQKEIYSERVSSKLILKIGEINGKRERILRKSKIKAHIIMNKRKRPNKEGNKNNFCQ